MPPPKYTDITPAIFSYVCAHGSRAANPVLDKLRAETEALGEISQMLIGKDQGCLMTLLVTAIGAKRAIEVGTFTGYSATCIALGLPADGQLVCVDRSEEWTSIARRYWPKAGVAEKIELRLGEGAEVLRALSADEVFDFAFIDADKPGYDTYYELLLPHIRPNGLLLFDNMLRHGAVLDPNDTDPGTRALSALNDKLTRDPRVESVLLAIGDGVNLCRKRRF